MKNNTIAIALASLLVGGVATAGYMNSRDAAGRGSDTAPHSVDAAVPAVVDRAAVGEVLPDAAIPTAGRLEYAEVVAVEPVLERETLYASVIGSEPVRESSTTSPRTRSARMWWSPNACRNATAMSVAPWPAR